jgi:hypothetical protein
MKRILFVSVITFISNFFWEISQAFLYAPHFIGIGGLIKVHIRASLGDLLIVFLILLFDTIVFKRIFSKRNFVMKRYAVMALLGFVLAVIIEKYALTTGRWSYNSLMPIIPLINVGLTPVLQMILLPSLVIFFSEKLKYNNK